MSVSGNTDLIRDVLRLIRNSTQEAEALAALDVLVAERDRLQTDNERLREAIHAAVSWTYIDGEVARLRSRIALKEAAGWPLTDGEHERLAALVVESPPLTERTPWAHDCWKGGFDGESRIETVAECPDCGVVESLAPGEEQDA